MFWRPELESFRDLALPEIGNFQDLEMAEIRGLRGANLKVSRRGGGRFSKFRQHCGFKRFRDLGVSEIRIRESRGFGDVTVFENVQNEGI